MKLYLTFFLQAATKCDSMTLTLGPWLGLPAVPAVTLYRHEDPSLVGFPIWPDPKSPPRVLMLT